MKLLAKLILRLWGWKINGCIPPNVNKCIIVAAPHTSNYDFIIGRLAYSSMGIKANFLIKKEVFKFPFSGMFKAMGGIPVDRGKRNNMIGQIAGLFDKHESLYVVITPEGTRKLVRKWKKGFYLIAQKANIPIALGYINYAKKEGGVGPVIIPTGDYNKDLITIQDFYRDITPRHPAKFNLSSEKM
ncbi:MAG: lysophospholipid acyltransferase family protein [Candidatus Caldatribacteriota bacterium]|nr:lysophospholipid acyltransferase family protein [Candidatus Caldatribacteriota bacterium]